MKIIDLINMKAEGKEIPKKIRVDHWCYNFKWIKHISNYYDEDNDIDLMSCLSMDKEELNYEVKVIDDEYKEIKPLTKQDIEALGYACGEIQKCFKIGWNKSLENKPFKEDNKIEKINMKWDKDYYVLDEDNVKRYLNERDKIEINKINEIIDYLKSKGE